LAIIAIVLVALVGIAEVGLRFALGLGNPVLIASDPACDYILKPDQNLFRFFVHTHINHYGMRSEEVPPSRTPGTLRLLFVGDSITYGTSHVDQQQIFTEVLHRDLPAMLHRPVEVLNASASAWAIDNELSYVRSRGIFQSDLVLLVLNDGDVTQPRATMEEVGDDFPRQRPTMAISELYTRLLKPRIFHILSRKDAGDAVAANADITIQKNLADLDAFNKLVTEEGARMVIVYTPFRRDIPGLSARPQAVLHDWTSSRHIPMVDVTSAEFPYSSKQITVDNGVHFNAKGHLIVAQEIEKSWPQLAVH
jgi:lysophospholipase L1-like esterase